MRAAGALGRASCELPGRPRSRSATASCCEAQRPAARRRQRRPRRRHRGRPDDAHDSTLELGGRAGARSTPATSTDRTRHGADAPARLRDHRPRRARPDVPADLRARQRPVSREWATRALSRGRESNRLYAVAERDTARAEYAPADPHRRPGRARLAGRGRATRRPQAGERHGPRRAARRGASARARGARRRQSRTRCGRRAACRAGARRPTSAAPRCPAATPAALTRARDTEERTAASRGRLPRQGERSARRATAGAARRVASTGTAAGTAARAARAGARPRGWRRLGDRPVARAWPSSSTTVSPRLRPSCRCSRAAADRGRRRRAAPRSAIDRLRARPQPAAAAREGRPARRCSCASDLAAWIVANRVTPRVMLASGCDTANAVGDELAPRRGARRSGGTSSSSRRRRGPSTPGRGGCRPWRSCACRTCGAGRGSAAAAGRRARARPCSGVRSAERVEVAAGDAGEHEVVVAGPVLALGEPRERLGDVGRHRDRADLAALRRRQAAAGERAADADALGRRSRRRASAARRARRGAGR